MANAARLILRPSPYLKPNQLSYRLLTTGTPFSRPARRKQLSLPASYYRGGTSRALIFHRPDLPPSRADWAPIFLSCLGSPDPHGRQLDGLGGGVSSLSKICVVSTASAEDKRAGIDVEYTFAAIGVTDKTVDYSSNCGNMLAAIGPWSVDHGLIQGAEDGLQQVMIRNLNSGKIIRSRFDVNDGEAVAEGDCKIAGVSGTGAKIELLFLDPAGSKTGKMLPTGSILNSFSLPDGKEVKGTCIDVGNPCVFVKADDLSVDGTVLPMQLERDLALLNTLESIRTQAAVKMGLCALNEKPPESIPKIAMLSRPTSHKLLSGEVVDESSISIVARAMSVGQPHRAVPITVAMALAAAADLGGSVAANLREDRVRNDAFTIGHPSGKTSMGCEWEGEKLVGCKVMRTARRIMEGKVYWKMND